MRSLFIVLLLSLPGAALACPTCGTASMPGLAASDLWSGYPLQYQRSGPRLALEGAADRVIRLEGAGSVSAKPASLQVYVASDLLAPATVAAGFSWQAAPAVGLHVCGPEITLSLSLP
ncbi:MAG: hypothetical protein KDA24_02460 [Deltaproteobacteria bacterium]|nr:hypothetical protein [Deltaproteobacteria bacterium]